MRKGHVSENNDIQFPCIMAIARIKSQSG